MIFLVMILPRYFLMQTDRKSNADVISGPPVHRPYTIQMRTGWLLSSQTVCIHVKGLLEHSPTALWQRGLLAQCQSPRCAFQVQQRTSAWPSAYHNHLLYKDPSGHLKAYTSVSSEKMTFALFSSSRNAINTVSTIWD